MTRQRQARNNNGSKFTVFSVATQLSWKNTDDEWASKTEWHRVCVFRPQLAEYVATTTKKESHVLARVALSQLPARIQVFLSSLRFRKRVARNQGFILATSGRFWAGLEKRVAPVPWDISQGLANLRPGPPFATTAGYLRAIYGNLRPSKSLPRDLANANPDLIRTVRDHSRTRADWPEMQTHVAGCAPFGRRGWHLAGEYVDVGISGTKEKCPELDRLMSNAHKRRFDGASACGFLTAVRAPSLTCSELK